MAEQALQAVVVGGTDLGDADRLVRLLTPEHGRIAAVARKARSSRRRFGGALDPGTRIVAHLRRGRGSLPWLVSVDLRAGPDVARTDYDRIALLGYGIEVCAGLAPEGDRADRLHGLLEAWLELLEGPVVPGPAARMALEAKALTFAGLRPALSRCAACGEAIEDPAVFDAESGGALHARCGGGAPATAAELVELEALRRTPMAELLGHPPPAGTRFRLSDFVQHQLGQRLHSRALLDPDPSRG